MYNIKSFSLFNESIFNITYINWSEFKSDDNLYDGFLKKAYFKYDSKEDEDEFGVSDINQFGVKDGSYFCTTDNCIEHYRDNPGYFGEFDFIISDDAIIAISDDAYVMQNVEFKNEIVSKSDGFYCSSCDTYGLVMWNKNKIKKIKT
jgi:hypothetical protein